MAQVWSIEMRPRLTVCAVLLGMNAVAHADDAAPKLSPAERREQLQHLSDDLNSPDPLKRLATMESVLQSNDLLAAEVAKQIALASGDETMRNYAGLLMLSHAKLVNVEISFPPDVQAKLDAAKDDDKKRASVVAATGPRTNALVRGRHSYVSFKFHDFDLTSGAFKSTCQQETSEDPKASFDAEFNGSNLQFRGLCHFGDIPDFQYGNYDGMCSGTFQFQQQGAFNGFMMCDRMEMPVTASFRLR